MLRRGRQALRLVGTAAQAAADARRCRLARRLGHGHGRLPLPDVRGRGARHAAQRRDGAGRDQRHRHGAGRVDRARPDRRRQPRARHRPDRVPRRLLRPARRRRRRRLGPYGNSRRGHRCGRQRCHRPARRPRHRRSRLAALRRRQRRRGRPRRKALCRRDDESRSESYADILARAGLAEVEGSGKGGAQPGRRAGPCVAGAWRGLRRGEGRSRSRPGARHAPGRRLRRRPDHQPAAGAQPALWAA